MKLTPRQSFAIRMTANRAISPRRKSWREDGEKTMAERFTDYDPAAALVSDEEIAAFMADAFETGDASFIAKSLGVVARAKGMAQIASQTGLSREQLYRSFSANGNPTLKTTLAVMRALGIELTAKVPTAA
jgi:probable addiction module antidote protein